MEACYFNINHGDDGQRLDVILARAYPQYSRVYLQKLIGQGSVTLQGAPVKASYRARPGEVFQISFRPNPPVLPFQKVGRQAGLCLRGDGGRHLEPAVLYEDEALLVIDKPAGLVVHPAPGHPTGTLIDWLRDHLGPTGAKVFTDPERLGLVHRLDKETSGVLLVAKSVLAQTAISRQFRERTVEKIYAAFIEGVLPSKNGVISAPVGRSRKAPTRMAVSSSGRPSETAYQVQETFGSEATRAALHPKTGRTHQIRVHLSAIGHPVIGDLAYGAKQIWTQEYDVKRPLLHAEALQVIHPFTGQSMVFKASWPADFHFAQSRFRETFKKAAVLLMAAGLCASPVRAQQTAPSQPNSTNSKTSTKLSALNYRTRKLQSELAALQESLASLARSVKATDAPQRLTDLEKALSEMNSKVGGASSGLEEVKTQLLELGRRVKNQQEVLDGQRDALGRLQRDVIQLKTMQEETPSPSAPAVPKSGNP